MQAAGVPSIQQVVEIDGVRASQLLVTRPVGIPLYLMMRALPLGAPRVKLLNRMVTEVGEALRQAHAINIVHGDVRAANILFVPRETNAVGKEDPPGVFVLIDWGLARQIDPAEPARPVAEASQRIDAQVNTTADKDIMADQK